MTTYARQTGSETELREFVQDGNIVSLRTRNPGNAQFISLERKFNSDDEAERKYVEISSSKKTQADWTFDGGRMPIVLRLNCKNPAAFDEFKIILKLRGGSIAEQRTGSSPSGDIELLVTIPNHQTGALKNELNAEPGLKVLDLGSVQYHHIDFDHLKQLLAEESHDLTLIESEIGIHPLKIDWLRELLAELDGEPHPDPRASQRESQINSPSEAVTLRPYIPRKVKLRINIESTMEDDDDYIATFETDYDHDETVRWFEEQGLMGNGYTLDALIDSICRSELADVYDQLEFSPEADSALVSSRNETAIKRLVVLMKKMLSDPAAIRLALEKADPTALCGP